MGYVIVTTRSLGWLLLSVVAFMAVLGALVSPSWAVAPPGDFGSDSLGLSVFCRHMTGGLGSSSSNINNNNNSVIVTSSSNNNNGNRRSRLLCGPLPTDVIPGAWLTALALMGLGAVLAALAILAGLLACCVHAICGKSILGVCGAAQAGAGVLYLLGIALFAGGCGADRVKALCGPDATPFYLDTCSLGWASYSAAAGALLTLLAGVLSVPADRAARSDKVQERIYQGHTLVCIA